jgi:hypothetical protein
MLPDDVLTLTLDDHVHRVVTRTPHAIARQVARPDGSGEVDPIREPATRFRLACGLGFDARNAELGTDPRWAQGAAVDCAACQGS